MIETNNSNSRLHYVNNEEFLKILNAYIEKREEYKQKNLPPPMIPEEIGKIFIQIANKLSNRYNFNGYTYKDEMISDGILNAVEAIDSFDPNKSSNPFAYFTQIIYWAFVRRIEKEKKESSVKEKMMFDEEIQSFATQEGDSVVIPKDELYIWYNN